MTFPLQGLWVLPEHMVRNLLGDKGRTSYGQMPVLQFSELNAVR